MAIISGMEAAKVDDVKPFELPVDKLALGIEARQKRADKAKELFSVGASNLNFQVRDNEEDYNERQKIIDEYNARIRKLSSDAGGDWSLIDNSQIQAEAVKSAQDRRVGHLITAKVNADKHQELLRAIEKENGFAVNFGNNPLTQALYNEDGSFRDLTDWSTQKKLSHQKAASDYFEKAGHELESEIAWAYSGNVIANSSVRNSLNYDFWRKDWRELKRNHRNINVVINNMIDHYIQEDAGNQYFKILQKQAKEKGMTDEQAIEFARNQIQDLIQTEGQKRYIHEGKRTSEQNYNQFPRDPAPSSPRPPGDTKAAGQKPVKSDPFGNPVQLDVTEEGARYNAATGVEEAKAMTSKDVDMSGITADTDMASIRNVHAVSKLAVAVPHRSSGQGSARNLDGTIYRAAQNFGDGNRMYGNNPTCLRTADYSYYVTSDGKTFKGVEQVPILGDIAIKRAQDALALYEKGDDHGIAALEEYDLLRVYLDMANKNPEMSKLSKEAKEKWAMDKVNEFTGGADGDMGSMFNYQYHDDKGFSTYTVVPELKTALKLIEEDIAQNTRDLARTDLTEKQKEYLKIKDQTDKLKLQNLAKKISEAEEMIPLLNTDYETLLAENPDLTSSENSRKLAIAKTAENARNQQKAISMQAAGLVALDWGLMQNCGGTYQQWLALSGNTEALEAIRKSKDGARFDKTVDSYSNLSGAAAAKALGLESTFTLNYESQVKEARSYYDSPLLAGEFSKEGREHFKKQVDNVAKAASKFSVDFVNGNVNLNEIVEMSFYTQDKSNYGYTKRMYKDDYAKTFHQAFGSDKVGAGSIATPVKDIVPYIFKKAGIPAEIAAEMYKNNPHLFDVLDYPNDIIESKCNTVRSDENGTTSISIRPDVEANRTNLKNAYSKSFGEQIQKRTDLDPAVLKYLQKNEQAKVERIVFSKLYTMDDGTTEGKEARATFNNMANSQLKAITGGSATNANNEQLKLRRVVYGGYDKDGKRQDITTEILNLEEPIIQGALEFARSTEKDKNVGLYDILSKPENFMGIRYDAYNEATPFNAIYRLPLPGGGDLLIEMDLASLDEAQLTMLGLPANYIQYGEEVRRTLKESANTSFTLTVPNTKGYTEPSTERYYVLNYPIKLPTVNGGVTEFQAGSVIRFAGVGSEGAKPVEQMLKDYQNGNPNGLAIEGFQTVEEAMKSFHQKYVSTDPVLFATIQEFQKMESDIMTIQKRSNDPNATRNYVIRHYGEEAWKSLTGGKDRTLNPSDFARERAKLIAKKNQEKVDQTRKTSTEVTNGRTQVDATGKVMLQERSGGEISYQSLQNMSKEDVVKLLEAQDMSPKKKEQRDEVVKALKENQYETFNGKRYLTHKTPNGELPPDLSTKNYGTSTTTLYGGGRCYQFLELQDDATAQQYRQRFQGASLIQAKTSVPTLLDDRLTGALRSIPFIPTLSAPLEISSGLRALEDNLHAYRNNFAEFTNSNHFGGTAIDISTARLASGAGKYDGSGYEFLEWLKSTEGKTWMTANNIYVLHHTVDGEGWHIHLEYNEKKAGKLDDEQAAAINAAKSTQPNVK